MDGLNSVAAKKVRINLLYDFYGQLLTAKQQALIALYYQADLSLGEIAEQQNVSRQAVYDILKRSERTLEDFEEKLQLVQKHRRDRVVLAEVRRELLETGAELLRLAPDEKDERLDRQLTAMASRLGAVAERLKTLD